MAMLQARAWAEIGGVTLLLDLSGTGDSLSEFRDAAWETWLSEAAIAVEHLRIRYCASVWIWGIRTGALLAAQLEQCLEQKPSGLVLWQPVLSGKSYLSQFFRLAVASRMLSSSESASKGGAPREQLEQGLHAEVGGYEIGPALAGPMEQCTLESYRPSVPVLWLECNPGGEMSVASTRLISGWRTVGVQIYFAAVVGPSFWASQEIETTDTLIAQTTTLMTSAVRNDAIS